ncbi:hypothetical protein ABT187_03010 [Streptomyces sp. NPDC001817]|uniref:hypothetical protein n=1 Tax=Streptomyces sp. NPDC001817 TaxID=3154398 RepID=UPI003332D5B2
MGVELRPDGVQDPPGGCPPPRPGPPRLLHSTREGLARLLRHPVLRAALGCAAIVNYLLRSPVPATRTLRTADSVPARPGAAA